jgi:hypothetical protein
MGLQSKEVYKPMQYTSIVLHEKIPLGKETKPSHLFNFNDLRKQMYVLQRGLS